MSNNDRLSPRQYALNACSRFMRPIARYLIRNGVGFREFSEIVKEAYVEVTSEDYGIRGRPTNISRVAVLTGLTRKEVSRLRQKLHDSARTRDGVEQSKGRPELVLERWFHDTAYLDSEGRPLPMPSEGDRPSFTSLVRDVGGDIPPGAMVKELIRAGSVVESEDGTLLAVRETFVPEAADPQAIDFAGDAIRDLAQTINHNLYQGEQSGRLLERRLLTRINKQIDAKKFIQAATIDAEQLLAKLNDLVVVEGKDTQEHSRGQRVGIGIYLIRD